MARIVMLFYAPVAVAIVVLLLFLFRIHSALSEPRLQLWHTYIPEELSTEELESATWGDYTAREEQVFAAVRVHVSDKLPLATRTKLNRYYEGSLIYPPHFEHDWNRSFILEPEGDVLGVAVFLHGLTDSPYTLRHVAMHYTKRGFVSIGLRVPEHGTVPAALAHAQWEHWMAATRMAVREAQKRSPSQAPLHLVGFSNGAALAVKYTLDSLQDTSLCRPDQLVLMSPLVGVVPLARFAGLAALPSVFPAFAKAAWLSVIPEFNPFKYNSLHANAIQQTHRLSSAMQAQIGSLFREGKMREMPPILTFHSVVDTTVSTSAIVSKLYAYLPKNDSELVFFDINRVVSHGPIARYLSDNRVARMLPQSPQNYRFTMISNTPQEKHKPIESTVAAGEAKMLSRDLDIPFPPHFSALSHFAIPIPVDDPLYGVDLRVGAQKEFGVNLGLMGALTEYDPSHVDPDSLFRIGSNPFFPYVLERIDHAIDRGMKNKGI